MTSVAKIMEFVLDKVENTKGKFGKQHFLLFKKFSSVIFQTQDCVVKKVDIDFFNKQEISCICLVLSAKRKQVNQTKRTSKSAEYYSKCQHIV